MSRNLFIVWAAVTFTSLCNASSSPQLLDDETRNSHGIRLLVYLADRVYGGLPESKWTKEFDSTVYQWMQQVTPSAVGANLDASAFDTDADPSFSDVKKVGFRGMVVLWDGNGASAGRTQIIAFRGSLNPGGIFVGDRATQGNWKENFVQAFMCAFASPEDSRISAAPSSDVIERHLPLYDASRRLVYAVTLASTKSFMLVGHSLGGGLATFGTGCASGLGGKVACVTFNPARLSEPLNSFVREALPDETTRIRNFCVLGDGVSAYQASDNPVGQDSQLAFVQPQDARSGFWSKAPVSWFPGFASAVWSATPFSWFTSRHSMDAVWRGFAYANHAVPSTLSDLLKELTANIVAILIFVGLAIIILWKFKGWLVVLILLVVLCYKFPQFLSPLMTAAFVVFTFWMIWRVLRSKEKS